MHTGLRDLGPGGAKGEGAENHVQRGGEKVYKTEEIGNKRKFTTQKDLYPTALKNKGGGGPKVTKSWKKRVTNWDRRRSKAREGGLSVVKSN